MAVASVNSVLQREVVISVEAETNSQPMAVSEPYTAMHRDPMICQHCISVRRV